MVGVDEVNVVGEPTDPEEDNHEDEHLYNLLLVLFAPGCQSDSRIVQLTKLRWLI